MSNIPYLKLDKTPIRRGRTWSSGVLQRGSNHLYIVSSTNTTPIVLTVEKPHGYSDGQVVRVIGHDSNNDANGIKTVESVTARTFALTGTIGQAIGARQGLVASVNDGTGHTLTCLFKRDNGDADADAIIEPIVDWETESQFRFELTLTAEQAASLAAGTLYFEVKGDDGLGNIYTVLEGEVPVFDSTMD